MRVCESLCEMVRARLETIPNATKCNQMQHDTPPLGRKCENRRPSR